MLACQTLKSAPVLGVPATLPNESEVIRLIMVEQSFNIEHDYITLDIDQKSLQGQADLFQIFRCICIYVKGNS